MANNIGKAFEGEEGFLVTAGPYYCGGEASPVGLALPVSSFYVQTTPTGTILWKKYGAGGNDWSRVSASDFKQFALALPETSTTSTAAYQSKLSLTTPTLPLGTYRLAWTTQYRVSATNRYIQIDLTRNGTSFHNAIEGNFNTVLRPQTSGFYYFENISGAQTFIIQFRVNGGAATAFMSSTKFEFERIV